MRANDILRELSLIGVRELRFITDDVAVDQHGRKIKFVRVVNNGTVDISFKFI